MGIDEYVFQCAMVLEPHGTEYPGCRIDLDTITWFDGKIVEGTMVEISTMLNRGVHDLTVTYYGKAQDDIDQAIGIRQIDLNNVVDKKFIWRGIYRPEYPQPWASQQRAQGITLSDELTNTDYLGWNGVWNLRFSSPVFTWIHGVQGLGWIYD